MDWINYTLFSIGGDRPVLLIDLITSVLGLTCVFLAGRNSKYNFWVGYLYTAALFLMFWNKHLYASLILQPISLGINVLGHWRWTHPKAGEQSSEEAGELKVSMLTWPQRMVAVVSVFVLAGVWGWLIHRLGSGQVPCRSGALPGCLRNRAYTCGTVPLRAQEVGLLGGVAACEYNPTCAAHLCGTCVYADNLRTLPHQRHSIAVLVDETIQEECLKSVCAGSR